MDTATTNRELFLAAALMARPEFVPALFPPTLRGEGDLRVLSNPVAKAAISVLATQGPAFGSPSAMQAALADLPVMLEAEEVVALMSLIPAPFEVELGQLAELKAGIERQVNRRELALGLSKASSRLLNSDDDEALSQVQAALSAYQRGNAGQDPTAVGILERLAQGETTIRWRAGVPLFDELVPGMGPKGEFDCGILGQGEVVTIAARYGVGKSRLALNWAVTLLDQGASVSILATEDTAAAYTLKLIGIKFGLRKWVIERYLVSRASFLDKHSQEEAVRIEQGLSWFRSLGNRFRVYDGTAKTNIFKFYQAKALLEEDAAVFGATHTFIDYYQAWKAPDLQTLEGYVQELREFAGRSRVGVVILSQVSNETIKYGAVPGMVPTKGTSEIGQVSHFAYLLETDPLIGQREVKVTQSKGRDAGMTVAYAEFDVETGQIQRWKGTPDYMPLPEDPSKPKGKGAKR